MAVIKPSSPPPLVVLHCFTRHYLIWNPRSPTPHTDPWPPHSPPSPSPAPAAAPCRPEAAVCVLHCQLQQLLLLLGQPVKVLLPLQEAQRDFARRLQQQQQRRTRNTPPLQHFPRAFQCTKSHVHQMGSGKGIGGRLLLEGVRQSLLTVYSTHQPSCMPSSDVGHQAAEADASQQVQQHMSRACTAGPLPLPCLTCSSSSLRALMLGENVQADSSGRAWERPRDCPASLLHEHLRHHTAHQAIRRVMCGA
jgi:hypothetical protein